MEQYFKEHSDNYDNIKKIISVVRFLDKYIKYGIMTQLKTDDWTLERKSNIPVEGSILIEYHHRQMSLSISGIKYVLPRRAGPFGLHSVAEQYPQHAGLLGCFFLQGCIPRRAGPLGCFFCRVVFRNTRVNCCAYPAG
jgi:hypothetical protein